MHRPKGRQSRGQGRKRAVSANPSPATDFTAFATAFEAVVESVSRSLKGKRAVITETLVCLFAEGHLLVEDAPGMGKTLLAKALSRAIGAEFQRVQFTPDLLPSDLTGVSIYAKSSERFEFRPGPVFSNVVLADEINRASPRTQAALLECMEERQVTVDGETRRLDRPFLVIATQNPLEFEGTYPLPESQIDRFAMRVTIGYPDRENELQMLDEFATADPAAGLSPVLDVTTATRMIDQAQNVHVAQSLKGYVIDLATETREHPAVRAGASPRATLSMLKAAKVRAAASGREFVVPEDIQALAVPIWAHRLILDDLSNWTTSDSNGTAAVLGDVIERVPVPKGA